MDSRSCAAPHRLTPYEGYLAVWMVNVLEATGITLCTDSWAIYKGLTLLLPTWAAKDWMVAK